MRTISNWCLVYRLPEHTSDGQLAFHIWGHFSDSPGATSTGHTSTVTQVTNAEDDRDRVLVATKSGSAYELDLNSFDRVHSYPEDGYIFHRTADRSVYEALLTLATVTSSGSFYFPSRIEPFEVSLTGEQWKSILDTIYDNVHRDTIRLQLANQGLVAA